MEGKSARWGRLALVAALVVVAGALMAPGAAFAAKAATRVVVSSQAVVDWGTAGVTPANPVVTAKLQKKTGKKWVALKGTVKVYYWNQWSEAWVYNGAVNASSVRLTMMSRGRYKLSYAGTKTTKSSVGYTKRIDTIGETVSDVTASFTTIDPTWTGVTVSYDIDWNTEAYFRADLFDEPIEFAFVGTFTNDDEGQYSGDVFYSQEVFQPGTVQFSYRVRTADIPESATFESSGMFLSDDPYIRVTAENDGETPMP